jgi:hypothetical protein
VESLEKIKFQARSESIRVTTHAQEEMLKDFYSLDDILYAIEKSEIIENYPAHKRGACCLLLGYTAEKRPIHIVCTTGLEILIIITVYEPMPPKWKNHYSREML